MLCCEIDGIFDSLVSSEDLLSHFFSILEQQRPLVSTRAGYFARVLSSLLTKSSTPVMQFVQGIEYASPHAVLLAVNVASTPHLRTYQLLHNFDSLTQFHPEQPSATNLQHFLFHATLTCVHYC